MKKQKESSRENGSIPRGPTPTERSGYGKSDPSARKPLGEGVSLGETRRNFDKYVNQIVEKAREREYSNKKDWDNIKEYINAVTLGVKDREAAQSEKQKRSFEVALLKVIAYGSAIGSTSGMGAFALGLGFSKAMLDVGVHLAASPEQSAEWSDSYYDILFDPVSVGMYGGLSAIGISHEESVKFLKRESAVRNIFGGLNDLTSKERIWKNTLDISVGIHDSVQELRSESRDDDGIVIPPFP
jgi:hypothetical protein